MSSHFFRLQQPHQISFSSNSHHQVDIPFLPRKPQGPIHHHEQQQQATIFHLSTGCRRLLQNVPTRTGTYWRRLGLAHTEDYYDWHILKTTRTGTYWRLLGLAHTEDYYVGHYWHILKTTMSDGTMSPEHILNVLWGHGDSAVLPPLRRQKQEGSSGSMEQRCKNSCGTRWRTFRLQPSGKPPDLPSEAAPCLDKSIHFWWIYCCFGVGCKLVILSLHKMAA